MQTTDSLTIQIARAESLSDTDRDNIIALCNRAYGEELEPLLKTFTSPTHCLGFCEQRLVSHAMWVPRYLQAGANPALLRTAYIEMVATDAPYRKRGFASAIMRRVAAEIQDFDLAALSPFSVAYYAKLGWEAWRGPLFTRTEQGLVPTDAEETVMILRLAKTPPLDITTALSAEWRVGELW